MRMRSRCAPSRELSAASAMPCPMFPSLTLRLTLLRASRIIACAGSWFVASWRGSIPLRQDHRSPPIASSLLSRHLHIRLPPFPLPPGHQPVLLPSLCLRRLRFSVFPPFPATIMCCCHRLLLRRPAAILSPLLAPFIPTASAYAPLVQAAEPKPRRGANLHDMAQLPAATVQQRPQQQRPRQQLARIDAAAAAAGARATAAGRAGAPLDLRPISRISYAAAA